MLEWEGENGRGFLDSDTSGNDLPKLSGVSSQNGAYSFLFCKVRTTQKFMDHTVFLYLKSIDNNSKKLYYIDNRYIEYRCSTLEMILWQENNLKH